MTKSEKELKAWRQRRREQILAVCHKNKDVNLKVYYGGVIQKGKL